MVNLLSEKYLNNNVGILDRLVKTRLFLQHLRTRVQNLNDRYSNEYYDKLLHPIADLISDNIEFVLELFWNYTDEKLPDKDHLRFGIKKDEEIRKLGDLIRNLDVSNENQTMAFKGVNINEVYRQQIIKISNFTLNRRSKLINDLRSTITLYYDVVLPFHDKNYDENKTDCTQRWDLPRFFMICLDR